MRSRVRSVVEKNTLSLKNSKHFHGAQISTMIKFTGQTLLEPVKFFASLDEVELMFEWDNYKLASYDLLLQIEEQVKLLDERDVLKRFLQDKLNSDSIVHIRQFGRPYNLILNLLRNKKSFESPLVPQTDFQIFSNDVHISHFKQNNHYYVKLEGTLCTPLIYVLAALYEVDLYPTWLPGACYLPNLKNLLVGPHAHFMDFRFIFIRLTLVVSGCISANSRIEGSDSKQLVEQLLDLFIVKRVIVADQSMCDILSDGSIFVHVKSVDSKIRTTDFENHVRADIESGFVFTSDDDDDHGSTGGDTTLNQDEESKESDIAVTILLGKEVPRKSRINMQMTVRVDVKLAFIPEWLSFSE